MASRFLVFSFFRGCFGQVLFSPFFDYGFQNGAVAVVWIRFQNFAVVLARLFSFHVFPGFWGFDSKTVQRSALCRSRRELSNEYLLAKIGVDTAENEPLEVWGKIQFIIHLTP